MGNISYAPHNLFGHAFSNNLYNLVMQYIPIQCCEGKQSGGDGIGWEMHRKDSFMMHDFLNDFCCHQENSFYCDHNS